MEYFDQVDWAHQWNKNVSLLQGKIQSTHKKAKVYTDQSHQLVRIQYNQDEWDLFKIEQDHAYCLYTHKEQIIKVKYQHLANLPKYTQIEFVVNPLCIKVYCVKYQGEWYISSKSFVYDKRMYNKQILEQLEGQSLNQMVLYVSQQQLFNFKVDDFVQNGVCVQTSTLSLQELLQQHQRSESIDFYIEGKQYRVQTKFGLLTSDYGRHLFVNRLSDTLINLKNYIELRHSLKNRNSIHQQVLRELNEQQKRFDMEGELVMQQLKTMSVVKLKEFMHQHQMEWSVKQSSKVDILDHISSSLPSLNTQFELKNLMLFDVQNINDMARLSNKQARFCSMGECSIKNRGFLNKFQIISSVNKQMQEKSNKEFYTLCKEVLTFQKEQPYNEQEIQALFMQTMEQLGCSKDVLSIMQMFDWSKKRRILEDYQYFEQQIEQIKSLICK